MGKFSAACFILLALVVISGELMVVSSVAQQTCLDLLPWEENNCENQKDGYPSPECLKNCKQRHPKYHSVFCNNRAPKGCVCEYPC